MKFNNEQEAEKLAILAIGRLFRLGSRPTEPSDNEQYYKLKKAFLDAADYLASKQPDQFSNEFHRNLGNITL